MLILYNTCIPLASRIRGYGYEVYMNEQCSIHGEQEQDSFVFVAQEVTKGQKDSTLSKEAIEYIDEESEKKSK